MKKIFKRTILLASMLVLLSGSAEAASISIGSTTASSGTRKNSVPIKLEGSDLNIYKKVEFRLELSCISCASISYSSSLSSGFNFSNNNGVYTVEKAEGLSETSLGNILFDTAMDLSENFDIVPKDVKFYKIEDDSVVAVENLVGGTITYKKPVSTDATLTSLTVSQGTMTPEFSPETTEYKVVVKDTINSIRLNAVAATGATKTGTGTKTLTMGENKYEISVTAEDGVTKKVYTVIVIRGEVAEPSAFLESLDINNIGLALSPEFDPKNNRYTVKVGTDITKLDIKYETEDPEAKVEIEGNENFKVGENEVIIKVTASDESDTQEYKITVLMEEEESIENIVDAPIVKKKTNIPLIIGIVVGALLILGSVTFVLFKKKKDKDKNKKKNDGDKDDKQTDESEIENIETPNEDNDQVSKEESTTYDYAEEEVEDRGVTDILRGELFEEDKTQQFDESMFKEYSKETDNEIDKTKEFDFKDFE